MGFCLVVGLVAVQVVMMYLIQVVKSFMDRHHYEEVSW